MNKTLLAGYGLIGLALLDSLFLGNVFGLQWQSPRLMYLVSTYLVPLKLAITVVGITLLYHAPVASGMRYLKIVVIPLAVLHAVMLAIVCLAYLLFGMHTKANFFREAGNIHVYTADAGAMGETYHYFEYMCHNKYGFYTIRPIAKLDWLGSFNFYQSGNQLIIEQQDSDIKQAPALDLTGYFCDIAD